MKKILSLIILGIFLINLISAFPICVDITAPTNPTNLDITSSGTNIILNWDAASDEPECSGIDYYIVLRDDNIIGNTSQEVLTFIENDVPYGSYSYGVYAVDKIGHNPGWIIRNDVVLSAPSGGGGTSVRGGGSSKSYVVIPLEIGNNLNLQKGVTYRFTIDGEEHTLTVDSIGKDYIWVTITSEPQKIKLDFSGSAVEIDLDGDEINDISLNLISIDNNGRVGIEYYSLSEGEETKETVELISEEGGEDEPGFFAGITGAVVGAVGEGGFLIPLLFIIVIVGLLVITLAFKKRVISKQDSGSDSSSEEEK